MLVFIFGWYPAGKPLSKGNNRKKAYPFLVNSHCTQLSYQRTDYMKMTEQIPKKTLLQSKQKTFNDKCQ
jgi:hypothetical protein